MIFLCFEKDTQHFILVLVGVHLGPWALSGVHLSRWVHVGDHLDVKVGFQNLETDDFCFEKDTQHFFHNPNPHHTTWLRYALIKKNDIIWEFFPNVGPPPLLGTPYPKKKI